MNFNNTIALQYVPGHHVQDYRDFRPFLGVPGGLELLLALGNSRYWCIQCHVSLINWLGHFHFLKNTESSYTRNTVDNEYIHAYKIVLSSTVQIGTHRLTGTKRQRRNQHRLSHKNTLPLCAEKGTENREIHLT